MDRLSELFEKQYFLQKKICIDLTNLDNEAKEVWTKENILAMHAELSELLEWINWKHWKKTKVQYTSERIKEIQFEIIDLFHFLINLALIWELTPQKMFEIYNEKNKINYERQNTKY